MVGSGVLVDGVLVVFGPGRNRLEKSLHRDLFADSLDITLSHKVILLYSFLTRPGMYAG